MIKEWVAWLFIIILPLSCTTTSGPGLFAERTPHQKYGQKLSDAGLDKTALGAQWFTAADAAMTATQAITTPYKEVGYFAAEKPRAVGFRFAAKRGQKLYFSLTRNSSARFTIYVDLWRLAAGDKPFLIQAIDTAKTAFSYDADKDEVLIVRLQPELLSSGDYSFSIAVGPSLSFPVAGGSANIGSFWGNDRDGGQRKHEGIDIFAAKGTPAIAAANGTVTSVAVNNLGGNVVFMRPEGKDYSLYYAHLDKQLVENSQRVKTGDTLGLVGNTGNAQHTASHLHFGIYTMGGAIDPLPFVSKTVQKPADVATDAARLMQPVRTIKPFKQDGIIYKAAIIATPLSVTDKVYNVQWPDGIKASVPVNNIQTASNVLKKSKSKGGGLCF
jgi:murein DD-endopeptidase MepM/ murein hydrolase activator NlpD